MPVETEARPAPSRLISTSTSVSLVLRFTAPLRMQVSFIRGPFIRGLADSPQSLRTVCKYAAPSLDDAVWGLNLTPSNELPSWHATTILTVRKGGTVVIGGDGQVSIGQTIVKSNAKKVRRLGKGDVFGGFAGATADAFTLFER